MQAALFCLRFSKVYLLDHRADKCFLFQAGGQREWGGGELISVLLSGMLVCFI